MTKNIYLVADSYEPNSAFTNRFLAFARGYGELGIYVNVVFPFPGRKFNKVDILLENVRFIYLWDKLKTDNKYIRFVLTRFYLFKFILQLRKNDIVILYGMINFLWMFRLVKNVKLYHERTESPDVIGRDYSFTGDIKHKIYLSSCKKLDGLFVISPSLRNYFVKEVGMSEDKVHVINMIVDMSRFDNLNLKPKLNTITYCGTISEQKDGISYLIKSFAKVIEHYNNITLTIIGGFESKKTEQNVLQLIKNLNIESNIILLGPVSSEEMPFHLSAAKILALSRPNNKQAQYGFPTKLGEYLMTENPVVITQVGDFDKYLEDKKEVIFSKPDDIDDFADKLLWVLDNYKLASSIGKNGKVIAQNSFNYKIESQKVLQVIFGENFIN